MYFRDHDVTPFVLVYFLFCFFYKIFIHLFSPWFSTSSAHTGIKTLHWIFFIWIKLQVTFWAGKVHCNLISSCHYFGGIWRALKGCCKNTIKNYLHTNSHLHCFCALGQNCLLSTVTVTPASFYWTFSWDSSACPLFVLMLIEDRESNVGKMVDFDCLSPWKQPIL